MQHGHLPHMADQPSSAQHQAAHSRLPQHMQSCCLLAALLCGVLLGVLVTWTQLKPTVPVPSSHHRSWTSSAARPSTTIAATATSTAPSRFSGTAWQQNASKVVTVSNSSSRHDKPISEHKLVQSRHVRKHADGTASRAVNDSAEDHASTSIPYEQVQQLLTRLKHSLRLNSMQQMRIDMQRVKLYLGSRAFEIQQQHWQQQQVPPKRGILIPAGGRDMLANALITIRVLREALNCTLPIEVVYFGTTERDAGAAQLLEQFNSTSGGGIMLLDGLPRQQIPLHRRQAKIQGFGHKVYALAFVTSFDQVLMLDADSMPLRDPTHLFQAAAFVDHGSLFWPDFWHNAWVKPELYAEFGMNVPWQHDPQHRLTDSGQLLLDRRRHADVLEWAWFLNSHQDVVYKHMHGDKDTYRIAFHLAGKERHFAQVQNSPRDAMTDAALTSTSRTSSDTISSNSSLPSSNSSIKHRFHHLGMLQAGPDGVPAFLHRTSFNAKFFPHCLHKPAEYCQVQWLSIGLTDQQARHSLKPHMYAFNGDEVDIQSYRTACSNGSMSAPDRHCNFTAGQLPIPVLPLQRYESIVSVLDTSYRMFAEASASEAATECTSTSKQLATVTYRGKQFQVPMGTKLRTALLRDGRVSPHNGQAQLINCRGIGSCGTCAVEIRGQVSPSQWTTAESLRLNFPPHKAPGNQKLRLACQVHVEGDIEVIKRDKFWGQGDQVLGGAGRDDFSLPLGQLEFILDRGNRSSKSSPM